MRHRSRSIAVLVGSIGLLFASPAFSAADKYAVVSAIGDELTIVTYRPSVGTDSDSLRRVVPLGDDSFDRTASRAAETAINRAIPDAVTVVMPPVRRVFRRDDPAVQRIDLTTAQLDAVEESVGESGARYLVLISKSKGETRLALHGGPRGRGKLFGIGFYFDRTKRVTQSDPGKSDRGILAPYAYLTLTLVDLQSGKVLGRIDTTETTAIPTAVFSTGMRPQETLPAEAEVRALNGVIDRAVGSSMQQLLSPIRKKQNTEET